MSRKQTARPEHQVGYGKPPEGTRFRKGESGNPSGRPKGTKNLKTDLHEELSEKISIREGQIARKISKQRALVKSQTARGIKGDVRAASKLFDLIDRHWGNEPELPVEQPLTTEELEILDVLMRRVRGMLKSTTRHGQTSGSQRRIPRRLPKLRR